jgi:hypothetical protein
MFGNMNGRGVGIPEGQRTGSERAAPGTVVNFVEAETFAVQYANADGIIVTTLVHRMGGQWHLAPNGENYAATLKPLNRDSKLSKALEERFLGRSTASIPTKDAVDIDVGG